MFLLWEGRIIHSVAVAVRPFLSIFGTISTALTLHHPQDVRHLQTMLTGIVAHPDQRLEDLPLLTEAERYQLLVEWNNTQADYSKDQCIHQLFEAQVERSPDAACV